MRPAAIIFDLDGTLIDSEPSHKAAEIEAFGLLGFKVTEADLKPYVGTTLPHMLGGLAPGLGVEEFLAVEQPILTRLIWERMTFFGDAASLMDRLDVPLALATSSMRWYLDETTARFPRLGSFQFRFCQADVVNGKPDPEIFLKACAALGRDPAEVWVIEDSGNGVKAALAAGCFAVGIDRLGEGRLDAARLVLDSLTEFTF